MPKRNLIVASTSTVYGGKHLDYLLSEMAELFVDTDTVIFIPYARPGGISHDAYTAKAAEAFKLIDKKLVGIHTFDDPVAALKEAKGVFTGGGNTFVLVNALYKNHLMQPLRDAIYKGLPYLGTSAGSNICGISLRNTNDMPIVYPPSFKTLGVIPFNINPHYLDPDTSSTHMGETRETRIAEFHTQNNIPVVGLREGSWVRVKDSAFILKGTLTARIFEHLKTPYEVDPKSDLQLA